MVRLFGGAGLAGAALLAGAAAHAGAIERSTQSVAILFQEGRYVEFSLGRVDPDVSGAIPGTGFETGGGVLGAYTTGSLGFKVPITPEFDLALVIDEPVGASVAYPAGALYPIAGTTASVDSVATTLMGRYKLPSNFSVIGGIRVIRTSGEVAITYLGQPISYRMDTSTETDLGYLVGVAWERPDIALRVALTYNSAIDHDFAAHEQLIPLSAATTALTTTIPQSVNLEFQTGIMADTLLFGSVRWVDWSAFEIDPDLFRTGNPANPNQEKLVAYEGDFTTWTLGVARRFTEKWSAGAFVAYEDRHSGYSSNLGPTNGMRAFGLIGSYTDGPFEISASVRWIDFKTAETVRLNGVFADNDGIAFGARVGYRF